MSKHCWCILTDHAKKPIGGIFYIMLTPEDLIDDLKKKIKSKKAPRLDSIAAAELAVWMCAMLRINDPTQKRALKSSEIEDRIMAIDFSDEANNFVINPSFAVANLGLTEYDTLLVQMPGKLMIFECFLIMNKNEHIEPLTAQESRKDGFSITETVLVQVYQKVFIKVNMWGIFQEDDVSLNIVNDERSAPLFVQSFTERLDKKTSPTHEVCRFLEPY
jgi:hypothetical protein